MPATSYRDLVESWTLYRQFMPSGAHWSPVYHLSVVTISPEDYKILNLCVRCDRIALS
jgi:hypothetical protein